MIRYYGFLAQRVRSTLLPKVHALLGQIPETRKPPSHAELIQKSFGFDPLTCILCGQKLLLSKIQFGTYRTSQLLQNTHFHVFFDNKIKHISNTKCFYHVSVQSDLFFARNHQTKNFFKFLNFKAKTSKEIAKHLNLSPRTIEVYFEKLKNKLNCVNKSQLIHACNTYGLEGILTDVED